jgi:methionyl-tRNA formyltransferase
MMKIGLLGCKGTTVDLLHASLHDRAVRIDHVVTLPQAIAQRNQVAFYRGDEIELLCHARGLPVSYTASYHLRDDADRAMFRNLGLDLLLVIGWERLLPPDILNSLGKFACGMHGSPFGLPRGRGRSPLNWSIITNQRHFTTSLFRYNADIDAGDILGSMVFDINEFDTIATLHTKNRIAMWHLVKTYVPLIESGTLRFVPQPPSQPTFYPKRTAEDSGIDWRQSTLEIYNLVRAVAPPYPSAFCVLNGKRLFITEAYPFDSALFPPSHQPGEVVDVSVALRQFVVKTRDGSLLVKSFEDAEIDEIVIGTLLGGVNAVEQRRKIVERYPPALPPQQWEVSPSL